MVLELASANSWFFKEEYEETGICQIAHSRFEVF